MTFLTPHIADYPGICQGKTRIPGVNDGEEFELTDVSWSFVCWLNTLPQKKCTSLKLYKKSSLDYLKKKTLYINISLSVYLSLFVQYQEKLFYTSALFSLRL